MTDIPQATHDLMQELSLLDTSRARLWIDEFDELAVVRRLDELDGDSRNAVETHLQWSYFCSTITAVHAIEVRYHVPHWDVETDKGRRVFELHSSRRDVRVLPGGRALVRDADGNVYLIPAVVDLDPASRAIIEDYV